MMMSALCVTLLLLVAAALAAYGLYLVLAQSVPKMDAPPMSVQQRQLRGFGFLVLAQICVVVGLPLCQALARL
jgi:hypothetical protein